MAFALLFCVNVLEILGQAEGPLKLTQTIPLPGVGGRIDHLAVEHLFVAVPHRGNQSAEIRRYQVN